MKLIIPGITVFCLVIICEQFGDRNIKPMYGGGCSIIDEVLYWVGGVTDRSEGVSSYVKDVYRLNLNTSFSLDVIPWEIDSFGTNQTPIFVYPQVIERGKFYTDIYVFGGKNNKDHGSSFWYYDTKTDTWISDPQSSNLYRADPQANNYSKSENYIYKASWNENPKDIEQLILFGGDYPDELKRNVSRKNDNDNKSLDDEVDLKGLKFYEMDWRGWYVSEPDPNIYYPADHASCYWKDLLFTFGGIDTNNNMFNSFDQIQIYNVSSHSWITKKTSGTSPSPRIGHSAFTIEDKIYISGGASDLALTQFPNTIHSYDILKNRWEALRFEGFIAPGYRGCVRIFNGYILITLGLSDPFETKMQILDVKNKKLVKQFHPNKRLLESGSSQSFTTLIIIITVVSILLLGIAFFFFWRYKKSKSQPLERKSNSRPGSMVSIFPTIPDPIWQPPTIPNFITDDDSLLDENIYKLGEEISNDWDTSETLSSVYSR